MKNKPLILPLILLAVFTLLCFNIDPADGIVVDNPETREISWDGPEYVTTVEVSLSDTVVNKYSDEPAYWFDTSLLNCSIAEDGYTVTLDFDVRPNALTTLLTAPSINSSKLTAFNGNYTFMDEKLSNDNILMITSDLNDIPLTTQLGSVQLSKQEPITVDNAYRVIITLENTRAGTREARFKLGRNSFTWDVSSTIDWDDNTLDHDNTAIVDGRLVLENGGGGAVDWWDSDWDYRVPIALITHTDVRAGHQYRINLDISDNLGGHANADFSDLRFMENVAGENGTYDWWLEGIDATDNATIWVERWDNDLLDNEIWLYYGNAGVIGVDNENGESVFPLFDEFDLEFDLVNKWALTAVTNTFAWDAGDETGSGVVKGTSAGTDAGDGFYSQQTFMSGDVTGFVLRADIRPTADNDYAWWGIKDGSASANSNTYVDRGMGFDGIDSVIEWWDDIATGFLYENQNDLHIETVAFENGGSAYDNDYTDNLLTVWDRYNKVGDNTVPVRVGFNNYELEYEVDNVLVRYYADPSPSATVGVEETDNVLTYFASGVWTSTHWELPFLATVDNLVTLSTSELRNEWDISAGSTSPFGLTYFHYAATDPWVVLDVATDNIHFFDPDFVSGIEGDLSDTGTASTSVNFALSIGGENMLLICEPGQVDNYNESGAYQNTIDVSNEMTAVNDVEHMENDDTYYVLSGDTGDDGVYVYDSQNAYTSVRHDLGLSNTAYGIHHDNHYWYVISYLNTIHQYDNNFIKTGWSRILSAEDLGVTDIYSNGENIYALGSATDTVYMYEIDNTLENIYAMIIWDNNNDNTMDENTGWHLMDEDGYWLDVENVSGYNFQVAFKLETSDNLFTPRIGRFVLRVNYYMEWTTADSWTNTFVVVGEVTPPLEDINELINALLPLLVLFAPAVAMGNKMGEVGFMGGLLVGTMIVFIAFDFSLGIVIFLLMLVGIMFMKAR